VKNSLKKIRFDKGDLSQQHVAELVGVSRQTIISIERGDYNPSVKLALMLAAKLEVSIDQLFQLEEADHDETR
jgi:putative transcriptional regulator